MMLTEAQRKVLEKDFSYGGFQESVQVQADKLKSGLSSAFDIDDPEKELSEYEDSYKSFKKAKKKQVSAANEYYDAAKEYNRLSQEFSDAEKTGDVVRCNLLLSEIQDAAMSLERTEAALKEAEKEVWEADRLLKKEKEEAELSSEKAAEEGDSRYKKLSEGQTAILDNYKNSVDKELNEKISDAKALVAEADRTMKHSLEKIKGNARSIGSHGMGAAKAMSDPSGNGGVKVMEAAVMGIASLTRSAIDALEYVRASIAKRSATDKVLELKGAKDGKKSELSGLSTKTAEEDDYCL